MDEEDGANMDPAGKGFDDMINPDGEAVETHCASCPSVPTEHMGMAMLLEAACSCGWTSGEVVACKDEDEQANVLDGGSIPRGRPYARARGGDDCRGNNIPNSVSTGARLRQAFVDQSAQSPALNGH